MAELFTFEQTPWELALAGLRRGDKLSAARFLTLLERQNAGIQHPNYLRGMTL